MIKDQKVVVVLPAYNAEQTLYHTYNEIPHDLVDEIIMVDDASSDNTYEKARKLGIRHIIRHKSNKGYGANQKTCYRHALELNADIVIMLHPDYQYTPSLIAPMAHLIASGTYPVVLGSRILGNGALRGGMPLYKYIFNRLLTFFQNLLLGQKLSEYHTGYRAFHKKVLENINFQANSDDFIFDNQMLAQIFMKGYEIAEITCPTRYDKSSSSISLRPAIIYGLGVLRTSLQFRLQKWNLAKFSYLK
jgi:glycosyltransferase involved in cell wall biosynthesis